MNSLQVQVALADHARELNARVQRDGGHDEELREFEAIRAAFPRIAKELGVTDFVQQLGPPTSKRATWLVELQDGGRGVLKLVGRPELSEARALRAWRRAGVPSVEPLHGGMCGPVSVLLTRYVEAPLMKDVLQQRALENLAQQLDGRSSGGEDSLRTSLTEIFATLRDAHLDAAAAPGVDEIAARIVPQLEWAMGVLRQHSMPPHPDVFAACDRLLAGPRSLIHGDPSGSNMLYVDGSIVIFDGGFIGPAAYDAAQVISEMVPGHRTEEAIDLACEVDPSLNRADVAAFVGLTLTLHAAYAIARNEVPGELRELKGLYGDVTTCELGASRASALLRRASEVLEQSVPEMLPLRRRVAPALRSIEAPSQQRALG